uniref:Uncharacterized protein n=1 Tax=uncultured prokaryote TaxID=198431 RepID=A0A0H5PWS1_9ZZZZ|nr:hypothetical protein [uncultured prokaryote]
MTDYRVVVRHVRYWRGTPHRWSTVYPLTGTVSSSNYGALITAMKSLDSNMCYSGNSVATGGIYEVALYNQASGGVPISITTYFPWATPASWVAYTSGGWPSVTTPASSVAESALQVEWLAGLSSSGKPVSFKKWYHAVPETPSTDVGIDLTSAQITSLQNAWTSGFGTVAGLGVLLGNSRRLAASTPTVRSAIGNHQMPRGRKKKLTAARAQSLGSQVFQLVEGGNSQVGS